MGRTRVRSSSAPPGHRFSLFTMSNSPGVTHPCRPRASGDPRTRTPRWSWGYGSPLAWGRQRYEVFAVGLFIFSSFLSLDRSFLLLIPRPDGGGRSADRRPDAASASGCVHDRTRALTFEARARRRSYPTPRLSALHRDVFWTRPSALLSLFPGPGSNGCSLGSCSRDAGRCPPRCGGKPRRGRHTLLGLSGSPLEKTPRMSKADALCSIFPFRSQDKPSRRNHECVIARDKPAA
jgi:hypothetical protein